METLPSSGSCLGLTALCCVCALTAGGSWKYLPWSANDQDTSCLGSEGWEMGAHLLPSPQGWCLPGSKVTDAGRMLHPLDAASCMERAMLLFHEHNAVFCHLTVSLRSPVAAWQRDVPLQSQHELAGCICTWGFGIFGW